MRPSVFEKSLWVTEVKIQRLFSEKHAVVWKGEI